MPNATQRVRPRPDAEPWYRTVPLGRVGYDVEPYPSVTTTPWLGPRALERLANQGTTPIAAADLLGCVGFDTVADVAEHLDTSEAVVRRSLRDEPTPNRRNSKDWLPIAPLLEAMLRPTAGEVAEASGACPRTVARWLHRGEIPFHNADRAACSMGLHPALIWGDAWWAGCEGDC